MIKIITGTKTPLNDIGVAAGICWHTPVEDVEKNIARAKSCILSGHGRTMEYPDVTLSITGYIRILFRPVNMLSFDIRRQPVSTANSSDELVLRALSKTERIRFTIGS